MKQSELVSGIWETLLPKALTLIDEISTHGGVKDPFFTFGGGTVLMLRYQHRFSKDIDIFVPDPQSLGYINPRLSDTAEMLCGSQYIEAENFVKLILEEGEIDFVASPNLLPKQHAFEFWNLFGREVRVETAAEIVAKKMFHRGDCATARDLFDLSLVIEREPQALEAAIPFMHRHLEVFMRHLKLASPNYIAQFNRVETIGYHPTFEHAAEVATGYLNGLIAGKAQSEQEARTFAMQKNFVVVSIDFDKGHYSGPIIHRTPTHLVQALGRNTVAIHDLHQLTASTREALTNESSSVNFRYSNSELSFMGKHPRETDNNRGR